MKKLLTFLAVSLFSASVLASPSDQFMLDGTYYGIFDDFLGVAPDWVEASGTTTYRTWVYKATKDGGGGTVGLLADTAGGVLDLHLEGGNEDEGYVLYWNDEEMIDIDDSPVMVVRAKIVTAVTTAENFAIGFMGGVNVDPDAAAESAILHFDAGMIPKLQADDAATDVTATSQTTFVAGTWYEFMVDATTKTAIKFYYRATLGGAWTQLTDASSTAISIGTYTGSVQPAIWLYKSTGATTPQVYIDYVRVWAARQ